MTRLGADQLMACELDLQNAKRYRRDASDNNSFNCRLAAGKQLRIRPEWGKTCQPREIPGETEPDITEQDITEP
jgi:hypothetical protein